MNIAHSSLTLLKCFNGLVVCVPTLLAPSAPSPGARSSRGHGSTGRWLWPRQPEEQLLHSLALHSSITQHQGPQETALEQETRREVRYEVGHLTLGSKEALFLFSSSSTLWRISAEMFLASNVAMSSLTPRFARKLQKRVTTSAAGWKNLRKDTFTYFII